jgi:hypothetical protein
LKKNGHAGIWHYVVRPSRTMAGAGRARDRWHYVKHIVDGKWPMQHRARRPRDGRDARMHSLPETQNHKYEFVQLYSDDFEEVKIKTIDAEIEQSFPRGTRRLAIFNGIYLLVRNEHGDGRHDDYWLNLAFLDPAPVRRADWAFTVVTVLLGLLTLAAFLLYRIGPASSADLPWEFVLPCMLLATACSAAIAGYRSPGGFDFLTRHGRARVLSIAARKPTRASVRSFRRRLESAIEHAETELFGAHGQYLRNEMKEHRRLQAAGVIGDRQFDAARALILRAHEAD